MISLLMSKLPPRLADIITAPLLRLLFGNFSKLGLKKLPYGAFVQIQKDGNIPLIDIGTVKHIRKGNIKIHDNIDYIAGKTIHFADGKKENFDAIVAATGYVRSYSGIVDADAGRFEDLRVSTRNRNTLAGMDCIFAASGLLLPAKYVKSHWTRKRLQKTLLKRKICRK